MLKQHPDEEKQHALACDETAAPSTAPHTEAERIVGSVQGHYCLLRCGAAARRRAPLAAFAAALLANAISISNIFPYAPAMVKRLGMTQDDRKLGFYAGFLMSAYQLGQLSSSYFLGSLADRWGRRRVMLIGLWSCTLPQIIFGLSPSFFAAVSLRFLMGVPNAIVVAAKAMAPEIASPSQQAFAMSLVSGMWGAGNILGPALGGLLSCTGPDDSVLGRFPFLLPNIATAALSLVAIAGVYYYIPDNSSAVCGGGPLDCLRRCAGNRRYLRSSPAEASQLPSPAFSSFDDAAERKVAAPTRHRSPLASLLWFPPTLVYATMGLTSIMFDEVLPLWAVAPRSSGGFGIEISSLGWLLSFSGAALISFQLLLLPILALHLTNTAMLKGSTLLQSLLLTAAPICAIAADNSFTVLLAILVLLKSCNAAQFTAVFTLINNSVAPSGRGRVQGLSMTFAAGFRSVGPTLGAELFAWSLTNGLHSPVLDVHLVFFLCALLSLLTLLFTVRFVPTSYNNPIEELDVDRGATRSSQPPRPACAPPSQKAVEISRSSGAARTALHLPAGQQDSRAQSTV